MDAPFCHAVAIGLATRGFVVSSLILVSRSRPGKRPTPPLVRSASFRLACSLAPLIVAVACSAPHTDSNEYASVPGYPATTTQLRVNLDGDQQKHCHATLVHPQWVLTAAHCFSLAEPNTWGRLSDFDRGFLARDVVFHPRAHQSGRTRLDGVWHLQEFSAAHDLALVPLDPPITEVAPVRTWLPLSECELGAILEVGAEVGRRSANDRAETAQFTLLALVDAAELLGPLQSGTLISARGAHIGPGDSGSGATAAWGDLAQVSSGCGVAEPSRAEAEARVLAGVVQDANLADPSLPFGLVPLHVMEHAEWLSSVFESTPPPEPDQPPLLSPQDLLPE